MRKQFVVAAVLAAFGATCVPLDAFAEPPPWAPAHGWRKHHQQHDDDDDRGGTVIVQQYGSISGGVCDRSLLAGTFSTSTNNIVGSALGGAAGGLIGNQFGKGSGKGAATLLGAVAGILVGGMIGRSMDPEDQGCVGQALEHAPTNQTVAWSNPDTGAQYQITPVNTYQVAGNVYCRQYTTQAVIDGRRERIEGTACRQPDGTWRTEN